MNDYEVAVYDQVSDWKRKLTKRSPMAKRLSKKVQGKINNLIPGRIHQVMTEAIKGIVKTVVMGSQLTTFNRYPEEFSLKERDELAKRKMAIYQKAALVEGAGTGAGGALLGLADFPLLLIIKMKLLFELAEVYGFDSSIKEERLFILLVFHLAFSDGQARRSTLVKIDNWGAKKQEYTEMDWFQFQEEYRDSLDFAKMLQLIPWIGAVAGAYANYNLLGHLGETAMNAYRLRFLRDFQKL